MGEQTAGATLDEGNGCDLCLDIGPFDLKPGDRWICEDCESVWSFPEPTTPAELSDELTRLREALVARAHKYVTIFFSAESAINALMPIIEAEINKLQEEKAETIEVLEKYSELGWGWASGVWYDRQAKPLLDKLKGEQTFQDIS